MVPSVEPSLIDLLHRAGQCAAEIFHAEISDLSPRQLAVLIAADSNGGASQTKLVDVTGIDRVTLTRIVKRLVCKGLLQRSRTRGDARAYAIKLTDEGRRLLGVVTPIARRVDERVIAVLSDKKRDAFLTALASIIDVNRRRPFTTRIASSADVTDGRACGRGGVTITRVLHNPRQ